MGVAKISSSNPGLAGVSQSGSGAASVGAELVVPPAAPPASVTARDRLVCVHSGHLELSGW